MSHAMNQDPLQISPFIRPAKSKVIQIINPYSGKKQPLPALPAPRQTYASIVASQLPTSKKSATPPNTSTLPSTTSDEASASEPINQAHAFDVYAQPFVPNALAIINTLDGREINTPAQIQIDFEAYIRSHVGQAFLPHIPDAVELPMNASFNLRDDATHRHYESYFRYHLKEEIQALRKENESYSLYGQDVTVISNGVFQTTCAFSVPGLLENSPYIEEDDIVQLRQLRYDHMGRVLGMEKWLAVNSQLGGRMHHFPAPGWTGIIYNARVSSVQKKKEHLQIRMQGLIAQNLNVPMHFPLPGMQTLKFNIRFLVPQERHLPMLNALPIVQKALRQDFEIVDQHKKEYGADSSLYLNYSASFPNSYAPPELGGRHWIQSMLFPVETDCKVQSQLNTWSFGRSFFDTQLNWEQKRAVESVCSHDYGNLPFILSGPPGNGKTKTIVEIALQLIKNVEHVSHILLCAPSDPAADILVQRLSTHFQPFELLRLNRLSRTFAEVPGAVLPFCHVAQDLFHLPPFKQLMAYKVVITTCRDASLLLHSRTTNQDLYAAEYDLRTAIHPHETPPPNANLHWTALLVDEAAQAIEPEVLIPLAVVAPPSLSRSTSKLKFTPLFVMAGDEHQLGPRTSLRSSPLRTSLFARLFSRPVYADHPLARGKNTERAPPALSRAMLPIQRPAFSNLIKNYRSHAAILAVPSALFYSDTLEPEAVGTDQLTEWSGWRGRRWPVLFHDNKSKDELEADRGGWYNVGEAKMACLYAGLLVQSGLVDPKEVCIMSPFKAQVQLLRKTIRDPKYGSLWDVDIGPTEAFQGLERGVVILCTTRSKQRFVDKDIELDWGIIGMPNKMNVALTRAKFGLIVLGNREVLLQDSDWKVFLDFCDRNGLLGGETDSSKQPHRGSTGQLTRLEKRLIMEEDDLGQWNDSRALKIISQDDEMWTNGMDAALDSY